ATFLSLEAAAEVERYIKSHSLPDDNGYILVEKSVGAPIDFKYSVSFFRIDGSIDSTTYILNANLQIEVPFKGWTSIGHITENLSSGAVTTGINLGIAKGSITFGLEKYENGQWLYATFALSVIGGKHIDKTVRLVQV
ncbi:hypothetical protein SISNIDRAFT_456372, partial [Sistotremastrum niveocremeum HHB9708]